MPEKLCKNCAKSIPTGEEIKIEQELRYYDYSVYQGKSRG
jgi:predicted aldo/keto reductase-like oxidoreductase